MSPINHEQTEKGGSFYFEQQGARLAEMVYVMAGPKNLIIEHTEVDESLKGRGIGNRLLSTLVDFVRSKEIKVIPLCPFASAQFRKKPELHDVLVNAGS